MDPYKEALLVLDKRRMFYQDEKQKRTEEIYNKLPKIKEIDDSIASLSLGIAKQTILGDTSDLSATRHTIQSHIDDKTLLLTANGYPEDYLKPHHHCPICEDSGFIVQARCDCLKRLIVDKLYERSNLKEVLYKENFDNFDIRFFSDQVDPETGKSPRDNMLIIQNKALEFVDNFSVSHSNLLFYGASGLGKTFLCHCIAKDLLDKNIPVVYTTSNKLTNTIEAARFNKDSFSIELTNMYYSTPLLIIDDLGTEFSTIVTQSEIFNIINTRLFEKKSTIISTNLTFKEIGSVYSGRTSSRLFGDYTHFRFIGEDIRIQKKKKLAGL